MAIRISDLPEYKLKPEEIKKIDSIIQKNCGKKEALIPLLQKIQKDVGFLSIEVQKKVAEALELPEKDVYGVVTFYSFFSMTPRGKNNIRVCLGTACFVKGGKKILDKIIKELEIKPGQTTPDRMYTLQINRCLGACGLAPIVVINDKIFQKVNPEKIMDIIYSYKK